MLVQKGEIIERNGVSYEVICADEEYFIIGRRLGTVTSFNRLEAYSNNEFINSLEKLNFNRREK